MCFCPMHACAFQACFHHQLVAAFHNPAANRPALGLKERILQLRFPLFQVSQVAGDGLYVGMLSL